MTFNDMLTRKWDKESRSDKDKDAELASLRAKLAAADKLADAFESLDGIKINAALAEYRKAGGVE